MCLCLGGGGGGEGMGDWDALRKPPNDTDLGVAHALLTTQDTGFSA